MSIQEKPKTNTKHNKTITEKGNISVHTKNLFPIIKKWLYSEHDIFLRELISNAYDAILKLERLTDLGEYTGKTPTSLINVQIDKQQKQLIITDTGLGMTADEVKKYINQVAFSGAEEFVKKYESKDKQSQIIGHFGLGFFSAFMVADKVVINTLSYQKNAQAITWTCDGSTQFQIEPSTKKNIGTEIIIELSKDAQETFLEETKITELVHKYSNFLPVEIRVNNAKKNDMNPLWNKEPNAIKKEDYQGFYKKLFPYQEAPLFHIHLNVDYPFDLKGILYFPKIKNDFELQNQGRIKLFCNNVFVSDNIIDIIPQYLNLLQGVIDSPDIPLNVSRSFLQKDINVQKIGKHIVKKIADKLISLHKNESEPYKKYWQDIHLFIKFGCISDQDFFDKVEPCLLFETIDNTWVTLQEYQDHKNVLPNKILYTSDPDKQVSYIKRYSDQNIPILIMNHPVDNHFMQHLEMKKSPLRFMRVDSDIDEDFLKNNTTEKTTDTDEKHQPLINLFKKNLEKDSLTIKVKKDENATWVATIIQSEQMRRFTEMSQVMQGKSSHTLPSGHTFLLNEGHPLIREIQQKTRHTKHQSQIKPLCQELYDLALLQQGELKGDALTHFITRTTDQLQEGFLSTKKETTPKPQVNNKDTKKSSK